MDSRAGRWNFYSYLIFAAVIIFQLSNWPQLPLFLDCYYHLSVMRGFADAGGWVGISFWDYAPFGRPHLYPPFFHILELAVFKCGASPILVAKIFDLLIYPAFLFAVWHVLRKVYNERLAFFALLFSVSSYSLYLAVVNNIPFSLAFIFGLLSFYFLKKNKFVSAILALVLSFYSHSLMSALMAAALFLYCIFSVSDRKRCLWTIFWAVLAALPLWYHQSKYFAFVSSNRVMEFYYAQINIFFYLLAAVGLILSLRRRGEFFYFLALGIAMFVMFFTNRDRYFSGHGLIPVIFLASFACQYFWQKISSKKNRAGVFAFWMTLGLAFFVATPLLVLSPYKKSPSFLLGSWIRPFASSAEKIYSEKGSTFYYPRLIDEVVSLSQRYSAQDDIFYSNYNYGGGIIASLAHRASSNAMLREILPFKAASEVANARFIIWFKEPSLVYPQELSRVVGSYGLKKVAETELVYMYVNEKAHFKKKVVRSSLPFVSCAIILAGVAAIFFLEK